MKVNLIILASGSSKRFNGNKLLQKFRGKHLVEHILDASLGVEFSEVIVVTKYEEIVSLARKRNFKTILNENSDLGISESIKLGLKNSLNCDAYMFIVGDQPFIRNETLASMLAHFKDCDKGICCASFEGEAYNPTIFRKEYRNELLSLSGDVGGKYIVKKYKEDVEYFEIKSKIETVDIDTREALKKYFKREN